jgi:hypothetical protein
MVGTKDILGETFEIHASPYGQWQIIRPAETDDDRPEIIGGSDTSLDAAVTIARNTLNKQRVTVEVNFIDKLGKPGVATKIHGRTKKIMASVGGRSVQLDSYSEVFKPDIPFDVLRDYLADGETMVELGKKRKKVERDWGMKLGDTMRTAIQHAVEAKGKPLAKLR